MLDLAIETALSFLSVCLVDTGDAIGQYSSQHYQDDMKEPVGISRCLAELFQICTHRYGSTMKHRLREEWVAPTWEDGRQNGVQRRTQGLWLAWRQLDGH